jgi:tetratricopeptide (TPR) repeat protein
MTQTARDHCREGRHQPLTPEGNEKAKESYDRAMKESDKHMPAYAECSYVHLRDHQNRWTTDHEASLDEAERLADQAVALADDVNSDWHNDFRGRWYRAMVYWNRGDFERSFQEFAAARALITDPDRIAKDTADLDADMAEAYIYYGDPEHALALIDSAAARYPDHAYWYNWNRARAYYMAKRYDDALATIRRINSPPNDVRLIEAASEAQLGNLNEARRIMAEFSKIEPDWTLQKSAEYRYGDNAARDHWLDGLRKAGLK